MKYLLRVFIVSTLLIGLSFSFTSCSFDPDFTPEEMEIIENRLVGTWIGSTKTKTVMGEDVNYLYNFEIVEESDSLFVKRDKYFLESGYVSDHYVNRGFVKPIWEDEKLKIRLYIYKDEDSYDEFTLNNDTVSKKDIINGFLKINEFEDELKGLTKTKDMVSWFYGSYLFLKGDTPKYPKFPYNNLSSFNFHGGKHYVSLRKIPNDKDFNRISMNDKLFSNKYSYFVSEFSKFTKGDWVITDYSFPSNYNLDKSKKFNFNFLLDKIKNLKKSGEIKYDIVKNKRLNVGFPENHELLKFLKEIDLPYTEQPNKLTMSLSFRYSNTPDLQVKISPQPSIKLLDSFQFYSINQSVYKNRDEKNEKILLGNKIFFIILEKYNPNN